MNKPARSITKKTILHAHSHSEVAMVQTAFRKMTIMVGIVVMAILRISKM